MPENSIRLVEVCAGYADKIEEYAAAFPAEREQVTADPDRIPGLDRLEEYGSVSEWLNHCAEMTGKTDWFLSVREGDGRVVGSVVFRHSLEYDDDDEEFCSHIGYSVRPDERRKGYAKEQLRLCLLKAKEIGLDKVRLICLADNTGSNRTILACGGKYIDTLYGEESGMSVNRYDIQI